MQKLCLRTIYPALEQTGRAAAGRAFGPRQTLRIEAENPPDARGDPKRREQSRRMKAAAMNCPDDTLPTRHEISLATAIERMSSRPVTVRPPSRPRFGALQVRKRRDARQQDCSCARSTRYACRRMPSACESAALANAAVGAATASPVPKIRDGLPATSSWPRRSSSGRTASRRRRARGRSRRGCGVLWRQRHRAGDPRTNLRHPFGDLAS